MSPAERYRQGVRILAEMLLAAWRRAEQVESASEPSATIVHQIPDSVRTAQGNYGPEAG